jgi:hypothetical protein
VAAFRATTRVAALLRAHGQAHDYVFRFDGHVQRFEVDETEEGEVVVLFFTPAGWVDVVEIVCLPHDRRLVMRSCSAGLFPTTVPCGPLLSVLFCCACFSSRRCKDGVCLHAVRAKALQELFVRGGMDLTELPAATSSSELASFSRV